MTGLPQGFVLDQPAVSTGGSLPQGFVLDAPQKSTVSAQKPSLGSEALRQVGRAARSVVAGGLGGVLDTANLAAAPISNALSYGAKRLGMPQVAAGFKPVDSYTKLIEGGIDKATGGYTAARNGTERVVDNTLSTVAGAYGLGGAVKGSAVAATKLGRFLAAPATRGEAATLAGGAFGAAAMQESDPNNIAAPIVGGLLGAGAVGAGKGIIAAKPFVETAKSLGRGQFGEAGKNIVDAAMSPLDAGAMAIAKQSIKQSIKTPEGANTLLEGLNMERQGMPLTMGQLTQAPFVKSAEGWAQRMPIISGKFQTFRNQQLKRSVGQLNTLMDKITPNSLGDETIGNNIARSYKNTFDGLIENRSSQGRDDFAAAHKISGGRKIIEMGTTNQALNDIIDEYSKLGDTPESRTIVREMKRVQDNLVQVTPEKKTGLLDAYGQAIIKPKNISEKKADVDRFQKQLSYWGKAADGTGNPFKDLDKGTAKYLSSRMYGALKGDLNKAIDTLQGKEQASAQALVKARDNWAQNSSALDEVTGSVLGKYFNGDFERTPERISEHLRRMRPSEIRQSMKILRQTDPAIGNDIARNFIESALEKSKPAAGERVPNLPLYSPAKAVENLPEDEVIAALAGGDKEISDGYKLARDYAQRMALRSGLEGSPTATLTSWKNLLNPTEWPSLLSARAVAKLSLEPKGKEILREILKGEAKSPSIKSKLLNKAWAESRRQYLYNVIMNSQKPQGQEDNKGEMSITIGRPANYQQLQGGAR